MSKADSVEIVKTDTKTESVFRFDYIGIKGVRHQTALVRVEIMKGMPKIMYGQNAVGGNINSARDTATR